VHFGVDSAVAFLALFVVLVLFFGVDVTVVIVVALVIGAIAATCTRRAEQRGLEARRLAADPSGAPGRPEPGPESEPEAP
jgi:hypothetical protein